MVNGSSERRYTFQSHQINSSLLRSLRTSLVDLTQKDQTPDQNLFDRMRAFNSNLDEDFLKDCLKELGVGSVPLLYTKEYWIAASGGATSFSHDTDIATGVQSMEVPRQILPQLKTGRASSANKVVRPIFKSRAEFRGDVKVSEKLRGRLAHGDTLVTTSSIGCGSFVSLGYSFQLTITSSLFGRH
ncbi:hypothetical protein PROFUN_15865 [Planoprotostelium fungivorum]|uniref:Uncharacterized protein n=1 Tax=Planoprotostelium fungivorum TaxID=1890364 RepID=A0A2P6MU48_9EUKA|nr:hypothetical protein PROFUN_15865 [Planoprotostelium fungivorum]